VGAIGYGGLGCLIFAGAVNEVFLFPSVTGKLREKYPTAPQRPKDKKIGV